MAAWNRHWYQFVVVFLLSGYAAQASEYNAAHCQLVVGTLNIHWEAVGGPSAPCTGIEFTDGTLADAADGMISMSGVSVSNPSCIGKASYTLTLSADKTTLSGLDTVNNVQMTLTRGPGENCFVGHWVSDPYDYLGHIAAAPFLQSAAAPALNKVGMLMLIVALAMIGLWRPSRSRASHRSIARAIPRAQIAGLTDAIAPAGLGQPTTSS